MAAPHGDGMLAICFRAPVLAVLCLLGTNYIWHGMLLSSAPRGRDVREFSAGPVCAKFVFFFVTRIVPRCAIKFEVV